MRKRRSYTMAGLKEHIFLIGFMYERGVPGGDDRGEAGGDGSDDRGE